MIHAEIYFITLGIGPFEVITKQMHHLKMKESEGYRCFIRGDIRQMSCPILLLCGF